MAMTHQKNNIISHTYLWQGINRQGRKTSGEYKGKNLKYVKELLRRQGITQLQVKKKSTPLLKVGSAYKITPMDIAILSRQLATMLSAGIPLVQCVEIIADGHEKVTMKTLLGKINNEIKSGVSVSQALRTYSDYFDELYCNLVSVGEITGSLDQVFKRIATYKEKNEALKSKIKKAMLYPISVISIALCITILLLIFVVPMFETMFANFGAQLPLFTQSVLTISQFIQAYWYVIAGLVILFSLFLKKAYRQSERFRNNTDILILNTPIISPIIRKASIARFSRTLATTSAAGVPLLEGLKFAAGASNNYIYRKEIYTISHDVESGVMLHVAMKTSTLFPNMLIQMVMIGEESGTIDDMLYKVANIYEAQVDDAVEGLTTLIEPIIMVIIGAIVGSLIIAMYLPIFKMGSII